MGKSLWGKSPRESLQEQVSNETDLHKQRLQARAFTRAASRETFRDAVFL